MEEVKSVLISMINQQPMIIETEEDTDVSTDIMGEINSLVI